MVPKKPESKPKAKDAEEDPQEAVETEGDEAPRDVEIEELPGGGTRETVRPSRRYSK